MRQPKIVIVGGSLVGPAGELFLRKQGFTDVTTYEANPKPFSQSGGVMGIRDSTLDMLAEIGITRDAVVALRDSSVSAFDANDTDTPTLRGVSVFPGMVTSWDALHHELNHRVDVQRGHTIRTMRIVDGTKWLICSCGNEHRADIVLWADGRKSTGRGVVAAHRPLTYNGYVVWRGLVDPPTPTPQGFHRYYDIEGGRLFSLTEPVVQSGKSYWEFSHNLPASIWQSLTGKNPEDHAYMLPHQVTDKVRDVIRTNAVGLPHRFEEIIEHSEVSGIPVNDVPFPTKLATRHLDSGGASVLFGDAAIPVRLQVGAGLNGGLHQIHDFADMMASTIDNPDDMGAPGGTLRWDTDHLAELAKWVELGRSRAHRNNLGWYVPVSKGRTTAPTGSQWNDPRWVIA